MEIQCSFRALRTAPDQVAGIVGGTMIAFLLVPPLGLLAVVIPIVLAAHAAIAFALKHRPPAWTVWARFAIVAACAGIAVYAYGYIESAPFYMDLKTSVTSAGTRQHRSAHFP